MSEPVTQIKTPVHLRYTIRTGDAAGRLLHGLMEGKLLAVRCRITKKVYPITRGPSPTHGTLVEDGTVELKHTGIVTSFCVVNVPFEGQAMEIPYVGAAILLDGADMPLFHVIGGCPIKDVRMGMRVKALWKPREVWGPTMENIKYFEPTGEPDAPFEAYKEHL